MSLWGYYFIFWGVPNDLFDPLTSGWDLFEDFICYYYYFNIYCSLIWSLYFASSITFCIFYYGNIYVCSFSIAFELAATMIIMHYCVSKPKSIN